jgi:polygalacturonase
MKTTCLIVIWLILVVYAATIAHCVCVGASVNSFGAKGDGHTDDTAAIQAAINAAISAGGGSVVFGVARYYTTAPLVFPSASPSLLAML